MSALTAKQISGFFEEWKINAGSKRNIPNARQCIVIEKLDIWHHADKPEYLENVEQPHNAASTSVIGHDYYDDVLKRRYFEVINATTDLSKFFKRFKKTLESRNYPSPYNKIPIEFRPLDSLFKPTRVFMAGDGRRRGRPVTDNYFAGDVAYYCRAALIETGWKNPSLDSRDGPVAYVVAKIISHAEGCDLAPSGAAARIRAANKDFKRLDADLFLERYGRA